MNERWIGGERSIDFGGKVEQPSGMCVATITDVFLDQLRRFVRLKKTREEELNSRGIRLLDKTIATRTSDHIDLGSGKQVLQIMKPLEVP